MKELTGHDQPSKSLIKKFYVSKEYESEMEAMKTELANSLIWISLDKTTDASNRSIIIVLAEEFDENRIGPHYLILCDQLQANNNVSMPQVHLFVLLNFII